MIKFSDLKPEQVLEICGKMRALEKIDDAGYRPNYPYSKDAMTPIIEGMTYSTELYRYHSYLTAMFEASVGEYAYVKMHKADAQQQFVAAAMALGLIKEGGQ
jgi:hypothetical protein